MAVMEEWAGKRSPFFWTRSISCSLSPSVLLRLKKVFSISSWAISGGMVMEIFCLLMTSSFFQAKIFSAPLLNSVIVPSISMAIMAYWVALSKMLFKNWERFRYFSRESIRSRVLSSINFSRFAV